MPYSLAMQCDIHASYPLLGILLCGTVQHLHTWWHAWIMHSSLNVCVGPMPCLFLRRNACKSDHLVPELLIESQPLVYTQPCLPAHNGCLT